jgi:thiosulfate/3-mercaptopyruvate sulfurtransferase
MPNAGRNADVEYEKGPRVPGALRWNLDTIADTNSAKNPYNLTHMLPSPERFQLACCESLTSGMS